jgi:hypothetical protein
MYQETRSTRKPDVPGNQKYQKTRSIRKPEAAVQNFAGPVSRVGN